MSGADGAALALVAGLFGAETPWLAFVIILALLAAIVSFMGSAWRHDMVAVWLFAPYAAWVTFATLLNRSIAVTN